MKALCFSTLTIPPNIYNLSMMSLWLLTCTRYVILLHEKYTDEFLDIILVIGDKAIFLLGFSFQHTLK
jgi:hypothetical protein